MVGIIYEGIPICPTGFQRPRLSLTDILIPLSLISPSYGYQVQLENSLDLLDILSMLLDSSPDTMNTYICPTVSKIMISPI